VPPGHNSTFGFTDPGHPIEGRVPYRGVDDLPTSVERAVRELVA